MAAFLRALPCPGLRHLKLAGLPVGASGARVLATDPKFAGLTVLDLQNSRLTGAGASAVAGSGTLANLIDLDLSGNRLRGGVADLADPRTLPRLGRCRLTDNWLPGPLRKRLRRRPGFEV